MNIAYGIMPSSYYSFAKKFVDYILDNCHNDIINLSFTGHSLGGFLAQLMSATFNKKSVVFESPGPKRVIDTYFLHPEYSIKFSSQDLKFKIKCFNAAPNLINIASGANVGEVIRLFPDFNLNESYTIQQHSMHGLLMQFEYGDVPKVFSLMKDHWIQDGQKLAWPFYEINDIFTAFLSRSYINKIFCNNINYNPYYLNLESTAALTSPLSRIAFIETALANNNFRLDKSLIQKGIEIIGDNSGNKFFGGTNHADYMSGGTGNDEYYSFSGIDIIIDNGGVNTYHFYTYNMAGITEIIDRDKSGIIQIDDIKCSISHAYKIMDESIDTYIFFPQLAFECNLLPLKSGSSLATVNYQCGLFFIRKQNDDLLISYNGREIDTPSEGQILIKEFKNQDFNISLIDEHDFYIAIGRDTDEQFYCSLSQNSVIAGLEGANTYLIPLDNQVTCTIIGSYSAINTFKFYTISSKEIKGQNSIHIYGMKKRDLLDFTDLGISNLSDLIHDYENGRTVIKIPGFSSSIELYTNEFRVMFSPHILVSYNETSFVIQDNESEILSNMQVVLPDFMGEN